MRYVLLVAGLTATLSAMASDCRCIPSESCWPKLSEWQWLANHLDGRLIVPEPSMAACRQKRPGKACQRALRHMYNPYYLQNNPGDSESQGWMGAWYNQPSSYAIEAKSTRDIATGVDFAREHNLRLVIKGAGHDYLGRSSAPNSLMIWTHALRSVNYNPDFIPDGCAPDTKGVAAVTAEAGARWMDVYNVATNEHGKYVQGGGCTTVGAAGGFTQGGGFGSYSKAYGTGAAGVVQVELVTADGKTVVANRCLNPQLFWAVRGGGGGTYGVVTKVTFAAQELPRTTGIVEATLSASDAAAYKKLIVKFLKFYRDDLNNDHWGEQFTFTPDHKIEVFMLYRNLSDRKVRKLWLRWDKQGTFKVISIRPSRLWNYDYWKDYHPDLVMVNRLPGAEPGEFWWTANTREVSAYWFTYQSWWLPQSLLDDQHVDQLAEAFFKASEVAPVSVHINKGLAGASESATELTKQTSTNPKVFDAAALVIMADSSSELDPKRTLTAEEKQQAQAQVARITQAMQLFKNLAPDAGTYVNEADYFDNNWQQDFWGTNYKKLYDIKQQIDPKGMFYCHHCVGSELWEKGGMCRK